MRPRCLSLRISSRVAEQRIAHLEQLVGRLTVALDIQKKALDWLKWPYPKSEASFRHCSRVLRARDLWNTRFQPQQFLLSPPRGSVRRCPAIGNRDACGTVPRYGIGVSRSCYAYGRVGTRRVTLDEKSNLLVPVKHANKIASGWKALAQPSKTLRSLQDRGLGGWYLPIIRHNGRFIYVCKLMDVFTRMIRAWQISLSDAQTARRSIVPLRFHDQGVEAYITDRISAHSGDVGERICWKTHPHAQRGRSSHQWLSKYHRGGVGAFYHTGVSSETPTFGVRVFDGIWQTLS